MLIYHDVFNGNVLSGDSYKIDISHPFFIKITGEMVEEKEGEYDIGGNASEEVTDEGVEKYVKVFPNCAEELKPSIDADMTNKNKVKNWLSGYAGRLVDYHKREARHAENQLEEAKVPGHVAIKLAEARAKLDGASAKALPKLELEIADLEDFGAKCQRNETAGKKKSQLRDILAAKTAYAQELSDQLLRKLSEEELAAEAAVGSKAKTALSKAIREVYLDNMKSGEFEVYDHVEDFDDSGMKVAYLPKGYTVGDSVSIWLWKAGVWEEKC